MELYKHINSFLACRIENNFLLLLGNKEASSNQMEVDLQNPIIDEKEKNNAICLLKTSE